MIFFPAETWQLLHHVVLKDGGPETETMVRWVESTDERLQRSVTLYSISHRYMEINGPEAGTKGREM